MFKEPEAAFNHLMGQIEEGKFGSQTELARWLGLNDAYISRAKLHGDFTSALVKAMIRRGLLPEPPKRYRMIAEVGSEEDKARLRMVAKGEGYPTWTMFVRGLLCDHEDLTSRISLQGGGGAAVVTICRRCLKVTTYRDSGWSEEDTAMKMKEVRQGSTWTYHNPGYPWATYFEVSDFQLVNKQWARCQAEDIKRRL